METVPVAACHSWTVLSSLSVKKTSPTASTATYSGRFSPRDFTEADVEEINLPLFPVTDLAELASQIVHSVLAGHPVPIPTTSSDIYAQIGYVMLIGLAAKNAILIVEFAKMEHDSGKPLMDAALNAAKLRFRPILMTAFAFILGVVPLLTASGAGAESRKVMGMAVFSGMLIATFLGVLLIPMLYVAVEKAIGGGAKQHAPAPPPTEPAVAGHAQGGH